MCDFFDDESFDDGEGENLEISKQMWEEINKEWESKNSGQTGPKANRGNEEPSPTAKSPRRRANFFADLVDQIVKAKVLLFTEDGAPFAYDEDLGCYQPVPQLTAWLANFFPEIASISKATKATKWMSATSKCTSVTGKFAGTAAEPARP